MGYRDTIRSETRFEESSAVDDVDSEAAEGGFFVFGLHIHSGLSHGLDHAIERDEMLAVSVEDRESRGIDRFRGSHGVSFDAGYLDEPCDRIAGEAQVVFHSDFGCVFDLFDASSDAGS